MDCMQNPILQVIKAKYTSLEPVLDERARRLWAGAEARAIGRGGITRVAQATGLSRVTVRAGLKELDLPITPAAGRETLRRLRRVGGGRKHLVDHDVDLLRDLEILVDPVTRGDPMSPLQWTCKSAAKLAAELQARGHAVSERSVNRLLHALDYSLQSNRKTLEGKGHPDRDAQFQYINRRAKAFQRQGQPVVSVDTKKKELVGQFRTGGREWHPQGQPEEVEVYDFAKKDLGKVIPYGVYDQTTNAGWVSVGIDHDTAEFAVETLRRWWRLWNVELQRWADEIGLRISVCHFPPGTSKWNKSEHRMFCHITENWRGRPLVDHAVVVNLIGSTQTRTGLRVEAELDTNTYENGIKVTDQEMESLRLKRDKFHGDWNYAIEPRPKQYS